MFKYTFEQNVRVIVGQGSIGAIGEVVLESGFNKAFLVYDSGIEKTGILARIENILSETSVQYVEYGEVQPDPPAEIINGGAKLCRETGCDCIIAIGGGSSIDTGKGINILRFNAGNILDYAIQPMEECSGLIVVPTTAGTGSELSNGAIVSDEKTGTKVPILCFNNMPDYAILDPELTVGMPYGLTLMTGLDAFSHAAESYTSIGANPMTDIICEKVMTTVIENLPIVLQEPNNIEARERMQCSASMGGWMLYSASAHVGHSIAHVIGAQFHLPHGAACAYTLPTVFKVVAEIYPEKIAYIGRILGATIDNNSTSEEIGVKTAQAFTEFTEMLQLKKMDALSLDQDLLKELSARVVAEPLAMFSPIQVDEALARKMLSDVLKYNG